MALQITLKLESCIHADWQATRVENALKVDKLGLSSLKRVGAVWKFKAVGHDAVGQVEPGSGPLTDGHNMVFAEPDAAAVNAALAPMLV